MNGIIIRIFAAGLFLAVAHALKCYQCGFGVGSLCITTEKTCSTGEHCYSGQAEAAGFLPIKKKGCLEASKCNKTSTTTLPDSNTTVYSIMKTCCNTDLCNAAPGANGLPLLPLMLASFTSILMATVVV